MIHHRSIVRSTLLLLAGLGVVVAAEDQQPASAPATDPTAQLKQRLDDLEKQIKALQAQVQSTNQQPSDTAALEARVWKLEAEGQTDNGYAFGGVGDVTLVAQKNVGKTVSADFNPIFIYNYRESFLFIAELNADENGVSLGQAWIAFTSLPHAVVEAGRFPLPFGVYSERLSPSWVNKFSTNAPQPYNTDYGIFSEDQTADGLQVRGDIPLPNNAKGNYHIFAVAAPTYNSQDFSDNRLVFGNPGTGDLGARLGFLPMPTVEIGVSGMFGAIINQQTADPTIDDTAERSYHAFDVDAEYHYQSAVIRGEYVRMDNQDPTGAWVHSQGAYLQGSHRLTSLQGWLSGFEPTIRIGRVQRSVVDNGYQDVNELDIGVNYYFTSYIRTSLMGFDHSVHSLDQVVLNTTFSY